MAVESIVKTLGSGSGIDVGALVTSLVEAQFSLKTKQLDDRAGKLEARISGVSTLKSTLTGFDAALKALTTGGTLQSRLASSNESVLKATALAGNDAPNIASSIQVSSLASAQVSTTDTAYPTGARFRTGTLTLRLGRDMVDAGGAVTGFAPGGAAIPIEIADADATLPGIAARINAAGAGLTARIVTDGTGERLSIAGPNGAAQAFELGANDAGGAGESLSALTVNRTATATSSPVRARDAALLIDGVRYSRAGNSITDLLPGVKLELFGTSASPVSISTTRAATALTGAVGDFVAAFNETLALVKEQNDPKTGALRADTAVDAIADRLRRLTTQALLPAGAAGSPRTLADLGVATARDGTLSVDTARLAKVMTSFPAEVERIFAPASASGGGLASALSSMTLAVTSSVTGLGASSLTYGKQQRILADARAKASGEAEALRARMTKQFSGMDARVSAYKSTQTFLDNQIKAWNRSDA